MSLRGFRVPRATVHQIRTIAEALRHTLQGQNFKSVNNPRLKAEASKSLY